MSGSQDDGATLVFSATELVKWRVEAEGIISEARTKAATAKVDPLFMGTDEDAFRRSVEVSMIRSAHGHLIEQALIEFIGTRYG